MDMKLCEEANIGESKWPSVSIVSSLFELTPLTREVAPPSSILGFTICSVFLQVEASWNKIKGICDQFSNITKAYMVTVNT
jgi:hypothetical protein